MRIAAMLLALTATAAAAQPEQVPVPPLPLGPPRPPMSLESAPPPPNVWQPRAAAEIQVIDKVYARRAILTIRNGETGSFGTLTVAVKSCLVRPPDRAPDAAAYLTVRDSLMTRTAFEGWMLHDAPAASMLEHPIYDIRVNACR